MRTFDIYGRKTYAEDYRRIIEVDVNDEETAMGLLPRKIYKEQIQDADAYTTKTERLEETDTPDGFGYLESDVHKRRKLTRTEVH